jgi:ribosome-binding factor A
MTQTIGIVQAAWPDYGYIKMKNFKRSDRLQEQMLRDVSNVLASPLRELGEGLLTFTKVRLTSDLRNATIYYSFLGSDAARQRHESFLERERGWIRSQVGRDMRVRHIPEITFKFDPSIEEGIRIEQLFEQIKNEGNKES